MAGLRMVVSSVRSSTGRVVLLPLVLMAAACGGADPEGMADGGTVDGAPAPDAPPGVPDAGPDLTGPVFEPDHLVEVEIELAAADWTALRNETRTIADILTGDCTGQPFPSPFNTYAATVTVDGTTLTNVGVHKKGFLGSLSSTRPSLKVKFSEFEMGKNYLGLHRLTLNNAQQDPSFLRQCLTYGVFAAAGLVAERCNFAHVTVNGEDLGLYVNVESVDKHFLGRHFADNEGNLYEGTLSDFRPEFLNTFEPKTNELTGGDRSDLQPLVDVLATVSNAQLPAALAPLLDVDQFTTYWATEVLTGQWDGYASNRNNFFVYHDPGSDQLVFLPWGVDGAMTANRPFSGGGGMQEPVFSVAANGMLTRRLYLNTPTRLAYLARLQTLLDTVWDEGALLAEIDRMTALVGPLAAATNPNWAAAVDDVRQFVMVRRGELETELGAGTPNWTYELGGPPCLIVIGSIAGSFSTTWDTLGAMNPFAAGNGTLTLTLDGVNIPLSPVGATAGLDPNPPAGEPAHVLVQLFGQRGDGTIVVVVLSLFPSLYTDGAMIPIDLFSAFGVIYSFDPSTGGAAVVGLVMGDLTLGQAGTTAGAPVTGMFTGDVDAWPF